MSATELAKSTSRWFHLRGAAEVFVAYHTDARAHRGWIGASSTAATPRGTR